jgi:hypothetical protein
MIWMRAKAWIVLRNLSGGARSLGTDSSKDYKGRAKILLLLVEYTVAFYIGSGGKGTKRGRGSNQSATDVSCHVNSSSIGRFEYLK